MGRHGGRDRGGLPGDEYDRKERELKEGRPRTHSASSSIIEGRGPFPHHVRNLDFRGLAGYRVVRAFAIGLPTRRSGVIAIFSSRSPALVALSVSGTSGSNPPSSSSQSVSAVNRGLQAKSPALWRRSAGGSGREKGRAGRE